VGDRVAPTVDALSMPFSVVLVSASEPALLADAAAVRELVRWNRTAGRVRRTTARVVVAARRRYDDLQAVMSRSEKRPLQQALSDLAGVVQRAERGLARKVNSLTGRLQREGIGRSEEPLPVELTVKRLREAEEVLAWVRDYLGEPHPQLGRKGQVCPFVKRSVLEEKMFLSFHDEVDGRSPAQVRDVVLKQAEKFEARFRREDNLATTLLLFPCLLDEQLRVLDRTHDELKTDFMGRGLMSTPLHRLSERPALYNPAFPVQRAPFAAFAIRNMVVQDIVFVRTNETAFGAYRKRFGGLYAQGKVSNEFGYVDRFREAEARFPK
jgi:hypothetical protein